MSQLPWIYFWGDTNWKSGTELRDDCPTSHQSTKKRNGNQGLYQYTNNTFGAPKHTNSLFQSFDLAFISILDLDNSNSAPIGAWNNFRQKDGNQDIYTNNKFEAPKHTNSLFQIFELAFLSILDFDSNSNSEQVLRQEHGSETYYCPFRIL